MKVKYFLGAPLVFTLFYASMPAISAPQPKVGANCSKKGDTKTVKGLSLVCKRSGKKLIWSKGASNNGQNPTQSATPTPSNSLDSSPSPSPTPSPTSSPTQTRTPTPSSTSESNLSIAARWNQRDNSALNVFSQWATKEIPKEHKVKILWTLSDKADRDAAEEIKKRYDLAARFWAPYSTVTKDFQVLIANHNEVKWICDIKRNWLRIDQPDCENIESNGRSDIATAGQSQKGNRSIDMYQVKNLKEMETRQFIGRIEHEFTHNIFYEQSEKYQEFMPCWQIEGGAEFFGILIARRENPDSYIQARNIAIDRNEVEIESWGQDDWVTFLHETDRTDIPNRQGDTCGPVRKKIYNLTILANEYLVEKLGIPGYLEIIRKASSSSWRQAVLSAFGKDKEAFYKDLASYMMQQYKLIVSNKWSYTDLYKIPYSG